MSSTYHILHEEARWIIQDEIYWIDALFPWAQSVAKPKKNIYESGKVCSGSIEKIWYVGL